MGATLYFAEEGPPGERGPEGPEGDPGESAEEALSVAEEAMRLAEDATTQAGDAALGVRELEDLLGADRLLTSSMTWSCASISSSETCPTSVERLT